MPEDPKPENDLPAPQAEPAQAAPSPPEPPVAPAAIPAAPPTANPAAPAAFAPKPQAATAGGAAGAPKPATPPAPKPPAVMVTTPWESDLTRALSEKFRDSIVEFCNYQGQNFLIAKDGATYSIIESMTREYDFDYLVDITAVHYPDKPEAFELIHILYSFPRNERVRVKTRVKDGTKPPSVVAIHPTADWLEREVYDMFGIEFDGHPNMKRILMPDEWEGYPLRKTNSILQMDKRWVQENLGIESGQ